MTEQRISDGRPSHPHAVHIDERRLMNITGVLEADSFCDKEAVLLTEAGILHIEGDDLRVTKLDLEGGNVILEGIFVAMEYEETEQHRNIWGKLFK